MIAAQKFCNRIRYAALTDIGCKKKTNQDRLIARPLDPTFSLFAVIDGLGGQPGGEEAAETVLATLARHSLSEGDYETQLRLLMHRINNAIIERGNREPTLYNMGAAATILLLKNDRAWWAHTGDCRLYHVHKNTPTLITEDQNLAWELLADKKISEEQCRTHRLSRFLSQCLGEDDIKPLSGSFPVSAGDNLLLCTDGVHDLLPKEIIAGILTEKKSLDRRAEKLLHTVLKYGGDDNIALILLKVP
ncbi:MAG: protein phosphatase 2C domain-containing protein [Desulfobulbaceae bacterium]|nr:protein phosphatase 2C domain-containing protein [Desulfobulbaceae bacterium]